MEALFRKLEAFGRELQRSDEPVQFATQMKPLATLNDVGTVAAFVLQTRLVRSLRPTSIFPPARSPIAGLTRPLPQK